MNGNRWNGRATIPLAVSGLAAGRIGTGLILIGFAFTLLCLSVVRGHAGQAAGAVAGADGVRLELNRLEDQANACRAYFVVRNGTDAAFDSLRVDLVIFDGDGIVTRRLALETAPLPPGKTSLKVFDLSGIGCNAVGRMLVNDVLSCTDADGDRSDCLDLVAPAAKQGLSLFK